MYDHRLSRCVDLPRQRRRRRIVARWRSEAVLPARIKNDEVPVLAGSYRLALRESRNCYRHFAGRSLAFPMRLEQRAERLG